MSSTSQQNSWSFVDSSGRFSVVSQRQHRLSCRVHFNQPQQDDLIIICHGLFASKDHRLVRHLASNIRPNAVVFDFHGNGESEGERDWSIGGYWTEVEDLRAVTDFLRRQRLRVVGIIGHSRAANEVLMYAMKYDDIPMVISIASRFDMARGITKHFTSEQNALLEASPDGQFEMTSSDGKRRLVTSRGIQERKDIDMSLIKNVKRSKMLLVHGTGDVTIPYEDARLLKNHVAEDGLAKLCLIDGASHSFVDSPECLKRLTSEVNEFIDKNYPPKNKENAL